MIVRIRKKEFIWTIVILLLFFQNWLLSVNSLFGYLDELVAVWGLAYYVCAGTKGKITGKDNALLLALSLLIIIITLLYNITFELQKSIVAIAIDIVSNFKFLFTYFGIKRYSEMHPDEGENSLKFITLFVNVYVMILAFCAVLNNIADIGMTAEIRYGLKSFAFIYGTPGHVINQMSYALVILTASHIYKKTNNNIWIILSLFVMLSTLKTRAFLLAGVYMALMYFFVLKKKKRLGLEIGIIAVLVVLIGYSQFEYYFLATGILTPRQRFVYGAIELVKEYFPYGTGFATFGSSAASDYYSPLYAQLGFSGLRGLSAGDDRFMNDNYFPMIFAQFGIVVALLFIYLLYRYFRKIVTEPKISSNSYARLITWFFVMDIMLSSIQSSYLAHYSIVTLTLIFIRYLYPAKKE